MSNSTELLRGKKIVIIGGTSGENYRFIVLSHPHTDIVLKGIGFSVAAASLAHGATVTISSRTEEKVLRAVERLGGHAGKAVSGVAMDAKDTTALLAFLDSVGKFDHLVSAERWQLRIKIC